MTDEEKRFELKEEARLDEMYDAKYAEEESRDSGGSMTDRELVKQWLQPGAFVPVDANTTRILIAALRERLAQPDPEPVAYLCENAVGHKYFRWKKPPSTYKPIALYTAHASPQRIWQGLLNEEVVDRANAEVFAEAFARGAAWAELKLKEKNND